MMTGDGNGMEWNGNGNGMAMAWKWTGIPWVFLARTVVMVDCHVHQHVLAVEYHVTKCSCGPN